jgi:hypothetical protein
MSLIVARQRLKQDPVYVLNYLYIECRFFSKTFFY